MIKSINMKKMQRGMMFLLALMLIFSSAIPAFAGGAGGDGSNLLDTGDAVEQGKGLFQTVADVLGTFLIIIGGIVAVYGLYTVGIAIKDGVSGQMPQSLAMIAGGVLMAVAGFIMKSSVSLFNQ